MKIEELKNFKQIPEEVGRDSLVDISTIDVRRDLPPNERMGGGSWKNEESICF